MTLICLLGAVIFSGCSWVDVHDQLVESESSSTIKGVVSWSKKYRGKTATVALFHNQGGHSASLIDQFRLPKSGEFIFHVMNDQSYFVAAFVDENGDSIYQMSEPATYYGIKTGHPKAINAKKNSVADVGTMHIEGKVNTAEDYNIDWREHDLSKKIGSVVSFSDERFTHAAAMYGVWKPMEYLEFGYEGLFLLDEFDPNKIPVLFIHGVNNTAAVWEKNVVAALDKQRFQPIIFNYPSGMRLDLVSDYLVKALNTLQGNYKFKEFYVVAHSMGGLVARSFVKKHTEGGYLGNISLFVTINSPMLGMKSAGAGVHRSPIVVPSWRDVASESDFIKEIIDWSLPETIPYYLFFSFEGRQGDDGVVAISSQLPLSLQLETRKTLGFQGGHETVLYEPSFLDALIRVIESPENCAF